MSVWREGKGVSVWREGGVSVWREGGVSVWREGEGYKGGSVCWNALELPGHTPTWCVCGGRGRGCECVEGGGGV